MPQRPGSEGSADDVTPAPERQARGLFKPWRHSSDDHPCVCGHGAAAHMHFRRGDDCGICGAALCARYRRRVT